MKWFSITPRILFLVPAIFFFLFGVVELGKHLTLLKLVADTGMKLAPTAYGEHSGSAVAGFALGLALAIAALRPGNEEY